MVTHWIKAQDGKEYPVRFNNGIGLQLVVMEEIPVNQMGKFLSNFSEWPFSRVLRYYWLALRSGAKKENITFAMTEDDFIELISDDDTIIPQMLKIVEASNPDQEKETPRTANKSK